MAVPARLSLQIQCSVYIARVAIDEDVDAVGLSILSGSHKELVADTIAALKAEDAGDIALLVGGTIPAEDIDALIAMGVKTVFTADMKLDDVIDAVAKALA